MSDSVSLSLSKRPISIQLSPQPATTVLSCASYSKLYVLFLQNPDTYSFLFFKSSDECIVKCASTKDENLNFTTITVKREDLAMKSAPTEYYFPAGTRVVAKSTPSTLHHGISPHFFSGTVAVPPLQQSRFDYLVNFHI